MDDLAQCDGLTPVQRGQRARAALEGYRGTIPDLIADLAHLADEETVNGGRAALREAEMHYEAEQPDSAAHAAPTAV
jgi:hypothetical protein